MPELFIEIYSEEIPASMQESARNDFALLLKEAIEEVSVPIGTYTTFATPRRLVCCISGVAACTEAKEEVIRGPKIDAGMGAIKGFMQKVGVEKQSEMQDDGSHFLYTKHTPSMSMKVFLEGKIPTVLQAFPWPKSMKWGEVEDAWIRPISSILCFLDNEVVNFKYAGIQSAEFTTGYRKTFGHDLINVNSFIEYKEKLRERGIILDSSERIQFIKEHAKILLHNAGLENLKLIEDDILLQEIAGLVEVPNVLLGKIDSDFLTLPREVIITTLRNNQKYLLLEERDGSGISENFIIVADGMECDAKAVVTGNQRVTKARLRDAEFFYNNDLKQSLSSRLDSLTKLVFHAQVGSVYDKTLQMINIASSINELLPNKFDPDIIRQVITLAKCDLTTEMVQEFPELQGIKGSYYAAAQGRSKDFSCAIYDHYKPRGPSDELPSNLLGAIVALSDKLYDLIELFRIGIKPTGSKDPYAQRRAAIGIIRIINYYDLSIPLKSFVDDLSLLNFILERLKVMLKDKKSEAEIVEIVQKVLNSGYNFAHTIG